MKYFDGWCSTLLASWRAWYATAGCSYIAGGAAPCFVDDFGNLVAVSGFPHGHQDTKAALSAAGWSVK